MNHISLSLLSRKILFSLCLNSHTNILFEYEKCVSLSNKMRWRFPFSVSNYVSMMKLNLSLLFNINCPFFSASFWVDSTHNTINKITALFYFYFLLYLTISNQSHVLIDESFCLILKTKRCLNEQINKVT